MRARVTADTRTCSPPVPSNTRAAADRETAAAAAMSDKVGRFMNGEGSTLPVRGIFGEGISCFAFDSPGLFQD